MRAILLSMSLLLLGCPGEVGERPVLTVPFEPQIVESSLSLAAAGGFADERGGGIFASSEAEVVRLRLDGTAGRIDSHPGNTHAPGKVQRVYPAGPFSALVAAEGGLFVADAGWLMQPSWRDQLDAPGLLAVAPDRDGVVWLAHQRGLFRIERGQLAELKVDGGSLTGITALAVAPAPDGANAVWFAQGKILRCAKQTARARYEVLDGELASDTLDGDIIALAGISAGADARGELWLATQRLLYVNAGGGWAAQRPAHAPEALLAAGRFMWLRAGGQLYRYEADQQRWGKVVAELTAPTLLAAEAGGTLWVRAGDKTLSIGPGAVPRLSGLSEGMRVYESELYVRAQFPLSTPPSAVSFALDDGQKMTRTLADSLPGEGAAQTVDFAWGGFDPVGREQPFSLTGLTGGVHTLVVTAQFGERELTRRVTFEFHESAAAALSFARDILPIAQARCAKCHDSGPGHPLTSYEQWLAEKDKVVNAVVEQRMPADGPLDALETQLLQRWAAGGAAP
jgi:ligand-binding sensor domain-containing protein